MSVWFSHGVWENALAYKTEMSPGVVLCYGCNVQVDDGRGRTRVVYGNNFARIIITVALSMALFDYDAERRRR